MFDMVLFFTISVGVLGLLKGCVECSRVYERMTEARTNSNGTEDNEYEQHQTEDLSTENISNTNEIVKVNELKNDIENDIENDIDDLPSYSQVAKI
jgi:hypothetical protein